MRVFWWQTKVRNESEGQFDWLRRDLSSLWGQCTFDRSGDFSKDLSKSISVGTRKTAIYACIG